MIIHVENMLICQRVKYQYNIGDLYEAGKNDNWKVHRESKKQATKLLPITLPNIGRFSKFFHC